MDSSNDRGRGVLSKTDREYIQNPDEYTRQSAYERRKHIRNRVYNAFLDGALLLSLSADERKRIFEGWNEFADSVSAPEDADRPEHFADPAQSRSEMLEKVRTERGLSSWFAFLYAGIEASTELDFQPILTEGIKTAERARGRVVTDLDIQVETRSQRDLDELTERFEQGLELTTREIQRLREAADVSDAELGEYYDARSSRSAPEE